MVMVGTDMHHRATFSAPYVSIRKVITVRHTHTTSDSIIYCFLETISIDCGLKRAYENSGFLNSTDNINKSRVYLIF